MHDASKSASTDAAVEVRPLAPADPRVRRLIGELDRLQLSLYPAESNHLDPIETLEGDNVTFLAAVVAGEVVGCGAVKRMHGHYGEIKRMYGHYGEIKRMYVEPCARGRGVGRALIEALESTLLRCGIRLVRLETGIHQPEALSLYERCGYVRIPSFGDYRDDPLSVFFEKRLA